MGQVLCLPERVLVQSAGRSKQAAHRRKGETSSERVAADNVPTQMHARRDKRQGRTEMIRRTPTGDGHLFSPES